MLKEQLDFSFVDIVSIHSSIPCAQFSPDKIEDLAKSFLETGGTIKPLIVKMLDMDHYEVISGHLEYYAALRARELDDNFELIRVIISLPQKQEKIEAQLRLLETPINNIESATPKKLARITSSNDNELLEVLKNQDEHIRKQLDSFTLVIKDLAKRNHNLEERINSFVQEESKENLSFLDRFNLLEESDLRSCLEIVLDSARTDKALKSILQERKKKKFSSLEDVCMRVKIPHGDKQQKAFGDKTAFKLFERWSRVSFKHLIARNHQ